MQSCKDHLQSLRSCEDLLCTVASLPESSDIASELLESVNLQLEEIQYRPRQVMSHVIQYKPRQVMSYVIQYRLVSWCFDPSLGM